MTTVYLIRHAEAEGNFYRRAQGQSEALLTVRGLKQVEKLSERFKDVHIDAVYSSDMSRTRATAKAIYAPKKLPLNLDPELREVAMGSWENLTWAEIEWRFPDDLLKFNTDPLNWDIGDNETLLKLRKRVMGALARIAAENDGKTIAVVSHGCAIRSVLSGIINGDNGGVENVPHGDNTSVSKIIFSGGVPALEYINDASHLDEETSTFSHQVWWKNGTTFDSSNMYFEPMTEEILALLPGADRDMAAGSRAALVRGVPSGFVRFSNGEIEYLYMHPDLRGTSMSNQLIGEVIYASRLEGIKTLTAHVGEDRIKCADVLLRCGFEPAGGGKYVKDIAIDND